MGYTPTVWRDGEIGGTPITADALNHLETQYTQAMTDVVPVIADEVESVVASEVAAIVAGAVNSVANITRSSYQVASSTYGNYTVNRIHTHGKFVPNIVGKAFSLDYEKQGTSGTSFIPPGEFLDAFARRTGAAFVSNASGWQVGSPSSNVGEMRGLQVKDGIAYHDFDNFSGSPAGREGLALFPDGSLRCISRERGDTQASVLAAGAVHTWCYGPNLVVNGVKQNIDANPARWTYFATTWVDPNTGKNQVSARTIIGQSQTGDIIIINVEGKTGSVGIVGNAMADLAALEGCYNASTFDGGGSAQAFDSGVWTLFSSDDATGYSLTFRKRKVGDFMFSYAPAATRVMDTGWLDFNYASGYTYNSASQQAQYRQIGDIVYFRGTITPGSGGTSSGPFGTSDVTVGSMPQRFQHTQSAKSFRLAGPGDTARKVVAQADGTIVVIGSPTAATFITLDDMSYQVD